MAKIDGKIGAKHQQRLSPYAFASNNPISINDPTGLADSTHKETSTIDKPKMLDEVIISNKDKSKKSFADDVITTSSTTLGYSSLFVDVYTRSGQLQNELKILESWKFQGWYKGELYTWKLNFRGNASVASELINIQKANFLAKVAGSTKLLEILKRGGIILNTVGVLLTIADIKKNGLNGERTADLGFGLVAFVPGGGWVMSTLYFIGKETGVNDKLVEGSQWYEAHLAEGMCSSCFMY